METRKRKRISEAKVVNGEQNEDAANTSKRQKQDKLIEPKHERSVQWFHQRLNSVQLSAGFPEFQATRYFHPNLLQLPLQPNVLTAETLHNHYKRPLWTTSHPIPVVTHRFDQANRTEWAEPMLRLYQAKAQHRQKLTVLKLTYARKKVTLRKKINGRRGLCPTLLLRIAEELDRDPDQWFTDVRGYDYYFTGGNLDVIVGTQFRWLLNTVGEAMNTVEMVPFELDGSQLNVLSEQAERFELGEGGAVFEIQHRKMTPTGQYSHIALRRKFQVDVLYSKTGSEAMKTHSVRSEVPFISCCFLGRTDDSVGLLCTSDLDKIVKVMEYTPKKVWLYKLQLVKFPEDECWTCLRPLTRTSVICLDRKTVKLIKLQEDGLSLVLETPLSTWLWPCESATCLEICPEESLLLVGTTHRLLVLRYDARQGAEGEFQQMITFTHNLQFHLTMIRYRVDSTRKQYYVHLSSHLAGDTMLCTFSKAPPKRFTTRTLPVKPLTIQESVYMARTKGKCLFPAATLRNRLKLFHSGIAIIADRDRFHLLVQNSLGDIYQQRLDPDSDSADTDQVAAKLHAWMIQLRDINAAAQSPVANDYKIQRGLRAVFRHSESTKDIKPITTSQKRPPRWRQTVEQLHQYKDQLAATMLSIWGFRPDVTESQQLSQSRGHAEIISVEDRIVDWLDATTDGSPELVEILDEPLVMDAIVKEEPQLQLPSEEAEDRVGEQPNQMLVKMESTPVARVVLKTEPLGGTPLSAAKGRSARKRYVQGF
ncbi:uncharacterized protein LOC6042268 [Culex quinquefasciatus]|uniref:uncharacterized protein LOC6042268 n=1 Tax=Culex quinquefasciatus TaxID=7176 RepID=UPI0018E32B97|nr:uncharacterized protein LOC6042268 [Culex quinquefasciatus]